VSGVSGPFATPEEGIEEIAAGRMLIVVDDEGRENEGDFLMAAEAVTPEAINFMATHGRGLICMPLTGERLDELQIPPMTDRNTSEQGTAFHVSIGAKGRITTGISAADRAATVAAAVDPASQPEDISRPGHVFPLRARAGGVLERAGHTEAAVDLARLAGLYPAGAEYGEFTAYGYRSLLDGATHMALVVGDVDGAEDVLVRVHSECLTGDVFHSLRCDCGEQLAEALRRVQSEGRGVVLYLVGHEGRGIGLANKLMAYKLQEEGADTVEANEALGFPADLRDYGIGAQVLADLGLSSVRLLTNNPKKLVGLEGYGLHVTEQVPIEMACKPENIRYMKTKKDKLAHRLELPDED